MGSMKEIEKVVTEKNFRKLAKFANFTIRCIFKCLCQLQNTKISGKATNILSETVENVLSDQILMQL